MQERSRSSSRVDVLDDTGPATPDIEAIASRLLSGAMVTPQSEVQASMQSSVNTAITTVGTGLQQAVDAMGARMEQVTEALQDSIEKLAERQDKQAAFHGGVGRGSSGKQRGHGAPPREHDH